METRTLGPPGMARKDQAPDWLLRAWAVMYLKGRPVPQCRLEQLRARYPGTWDRGALQKAG